MKQFVLLLAFAFIAPLCFSQTTPSDTTTKELKRIEKNDGTVYIGTILSDDGREVLINTESLGKIYIPKSDIKSIGAVGAEDFDEVGEYDPEGPFATRYYFTTNALPLKKGDDYAMIHLYGPEVHFSVGKNFSIGVMTTWFASPFILALKKSFQTKNEKINLSLGALVGTSGYLNTFRGYGGIGFGTFTYGTATDNVSFSAGYGIVNPGFNGNIFFNEDITADDGFYPENEYTYGDLVNTSPSSSRIFQTPLFQLAGTKRLGKRVSLIFDSMISITAQNEKTINYQNNGSGTFGYQVTSTSSARTVFFLMPGMRFQRSPKNAFQVALAGVTYIDANNAIAFPIPQCSWFFKF